MNSKHQKSDAFQVTIQLRVATTKEIYIRTQATFAKRLNVKDDILKNSAVKAGQLHWHE